MLKKIPLPFVLLILLGAVLLFGHFVPVEIKQAFLSFSLLLKSLLLFVLPLIIFVYLCSCLTAFEGNVFLFIGVILFGVCFSNFVSTMLAYGLAHVGLPNLTCGHVETLTTLEPLWSFSLPALISNEWALFLGFAVGTVLSFYPHAMALKINDMGKKLTSLFLDRLFIPLIPLFVLGFLFKMEQEGILWQMIKTYLPILLMLVGAYLLYLFFLYWVAARGQFNDALLFIRRALPAGITGFSSMSSAAAMPLTLNAAEKNSGKPALVRAIIPATVNIHLVGDSIGVPILAMAIMLTFGQPLPDFSTFLVFSGYFILAKFAIAAVPGGGVIVMLPVLQNTLGFSSEMLGLMTALYILFDPLFTSTNVMGNGAFSVILSRVFKNRKSL